MRVLHYYAVAGAPQVTLPLMGQAANVLHPFNRFLSQAIHTAKQRQTRYELPWERVRNLQIIQLEPLDTLLRVPRRLPGMILADWPADKAPDLNQIGFVPASGQPVQFKSATQTSEGLEVFTDPPLQPGEQVIWCRVETAVKQAADSGPPRQIADVRNRALKLLARPRLDEGQQHWLILVEGRLRDQVLLVDDDAVDAEPYLAMENLRRVVDKANVSFDVSGMSLRIEELPAEGPLLGNNGIRYRWRRQDTGGGADRRGCWIQLLPPESSEGEEFLDPRAAFCEGEVTEVWTQPWHQRETSYKVKKVDQDRYQILLDRYPAEGNTLFLPVDIRNLRLQKRAIRQLAEAPLPHHQGLLRLCEDPARMRWPSVKAEFIPDGDWRALTDAERSGTDEQREFVKKALATPDFAFLEGPPGSGKTTAICEIVQQLVEKGQRVLLCASTHVAIDNVLERLMGSGSPIDAVRIGKIDKVDDKVQATQLDARVDALVTAWSRQPVMGKYGEAELTKMAERTVIMAANLTCGTTMGIVNHPLFQDRDDDTHRSEQPITTMPHWDVLIVDEASKTLVQEFLVPALMAKRWIIVGDVHQLPPFADRADIVANLRDIVDEGNNCIFPKDHQRARLLLFRLLNRERRQRGMRWLIVESPGVLTWIERELEAAPVTDLSVIRVVSKGGPSRGPVKVVTVEQIRAGRAESLLLAAADWVLIGNDLIDEVAGRLPANLLVVKKLTDRIGLVSELRQDRWLQGAGALQRRYTEKKFSREPVATFERAQDCESDWLSRTDLAQEIAWRMTRSHELRNSRKAHQHLREDLKRLHPVASDIAEHIAEIQDIGLPSILEVLQEGIGAERSNRHSALTSGFKATRMNDFTARFVSLSYQHRMHHEISSFPREIIYGGHALRDANTIAIRDEALGWDFGAFSARRIWAHIHGKDEGGVNGKEIDAMKGILRDFIAWAKRKGPPGRNGSVWEVACLCFYVKQERAISDMLRELTRVDSKTRFIVPGAPIEIVCGTVDRFQGREADLVMLSMRNTERVGFLDSPNRLNVAVTRARQQLVIFGDYDYFQQCGVDELQDLANCTAVLNLDPRQSRRDHR